MVVAGQRNLDVAWTYPKPSRAAESIRARVAFWRGVTGAQTKQAHLPGERIRQVSRDRRRPRQGAASGHAVSGADERSPRSTWVKAALLVVVLGTDVVTWLVAGTSDVASLQAATRGWGRWAPVLFVAGYALITLTPVPKGVLSAAAGVAFGLPVGAALVYVAALLGAALALLLGRWLGRDAVDRQPPGAGRPAPCAARVARRPRGPAGAPGAVHGDQLRRRAFHRAPT